MNQTSRPSASVIQTPEFSVDAVVVRAHAAFGRDATAPLTARRENLLALRTMLTENRAYFEEALHADLHKSAREAAFTEIDAVIGETSHALRNISRWNRTRRGQVPLVLQPARARLISEPLGVVLVISPWNYPLQLMFNPLVGVLAAGNAAVLKPSSQVPHVAEVIARLVPQYFPNDAVQVVTGPTARTTALLEKRFDHIVFTGSAPVGRTVMEAAAAHLTPVTLELGGKSPVWFDDDKHLQESARRLAWAKFTNAGQTCVAPDYVMTTPDRVPALVEALRTAIEELWGLDPQASDEYGRMVGPRQFDRLAGYLGDGKIAVGGQSDREELYLAPTVLVLPQDQHPAVGPDSPHPVLREEIFGPVLPIVPVSGPQQAAEVINAWEKPLALYVFTNSDATRRMFEQNTSSGAIVHGAALIHVGAGTLPFGGVGESGMGQYHGKYSIRSFSHLKPVLTSPLRPDTLRMAQPGARPVLRSLFKRLQQHG